MNKQLKAKRNNDQEQKLNEDREKERQDKEDARKQREEDNKKRKYEEKTEKKNKKQPKDFIKEKSNDDLLLAISEVRNNKWNYGIIFFLLLLVSLSVYFQYKHELSQRESYISSQEEEVNHYEVMGLDHGADITVIKAKYKELVKIWHPDKNPNCATCQEKFTQIARAYEILVDDSKRSGGAKSGKSIFSSQPHLLTVNNYHHLVEESNDFWIIMVYENTRGNKYNQFFADVWDEVSSKYKHIVKFGVIDVLRDQNLLHFLPYKFQYFPNIFTYLHGEDSELYENIDNYNPKSKSLFNIF